MSSSRMGLTALFVAFCALASCGDDSFTLPARLDNGAPPATSAPDTTAPDVASANTPADSGPSAADPGPATPPDPGTSPADPGVTPNVGDPGTPVDTATDQGTPDEIPSPCAEPGSCPCRLHKDCEVYDTPENLCRPKHICISEQCIEDPTTVVECGGNHPNPCKRFACAPAFGICAEMNQPVGSPCDDGNPCSTGDHCDGGACVGGQVPDCDDGDPCTVDGCDATTGGCAHTVNACDDEDPCTADTCAAEDGSCLHETETCDDGSECTADRCVPGRGCEHDVNDCDDLNPCTVDTCDPVTGECSYEKSEDCKVTYRKLSSQVLAFKCVPCHLAGVENIPAAKFVGNFEITQRLPHATVCTVAGVYTVGECMKLRAVTRAHENGVRMPPEWSHASTWLGGQLNQTTYNQQYTLTEAERLMIVQWIDDGMPSGQEE